VLKDYKEDPLVVTGGLKVRLGDETLKAFNELEKRSKEITIPLLICHGTADKCTSPVASKAFYENVSSTDKTYMALEGLYHCIFDEKEKEEVIESILSWISRVTSDES
jgi:alpha-beta hydrolase superfamily lysophospholipase